MRFDIITLFPELFSALNYGITRIAQEKQIIQLNTWNPRDFCLDKHKTVDDRPYGGGPGMLMKVQPLRDAITAAKKFAPKTTRVIYLTPQGETINQSKIKDFSCKESLIFVCGRYEGVDQRVIDHDIDECWSVGDYVLSGGELPCMTIIDAITRLLPGALGHPNAAEDDSFSNKFLECPHYTRPEQLEGAEVPKVLLSGDHAAIARWRKKQAIGQTWLKRPDLLNTITLSEEEKYLLAEFIKQQF